MTVLQSLLSTFRRSRQMTRKARRNPAASSVSSEALEPRLLLTNPDPFQSLEGAPVTIYLDFDGHTETSQAWLDRRRPGTSGDIVTPVFSSDADDNFSQPERDRIEEIFERVAEDFRPFNINVTTIEPPAFNNSSEILVSIGGDGSWLPGTNPRFVALKNSFSQGNLPQTVFVFSQNHTGLGGEVPYNMAASVSAAVAESMGLDIHENPNDTPLEGDAFVAPILGDQIVGVDTDVNNDNSLRDVWFLAPGAGTAVQDDLALIVANPNVNYRVDDHGDSDVAATGIPISTGQETVQGVIERNTDRDVFSFTTAATTATINLTGLDLRARFGAPTPGSNLDPILTLRDANGTVLQSEAPAGLQASITLAIPDGTYYLEVSNGGEYGNLGEYTITIDNVDVLPAFANPISQSSKPNAPVTFYLAFAGGVIPDMDPLLAGRTTGQGDLTVRAYDTDGNTTFSATEAAEAFEIWARVAEDFRPFNVNVTTVNPNSFQDLQGLRVFIGGDGIEFGSPDSVALLDAFSSAAATNSGIVFSENIQTGSINDPKRVAYHVSAAIGRMLGLLDHPQYNFGGTQIAPLDPGSAAIGPIMGAPDNSQRDVWVNAPTTTAANFQDDLAVITEPASNNIVYRTDDHGDVPALATPVTVDVGDDFIHGIIETQNDVDVFRIDTLATTMTVSVKGLDLSEMFPGVNAGSNLDPVLELRDGTGTLIARADVPYTLANGNASLTASITQTVPAGTYYVQVSNRGEYGNLGEYTIRLEGVDSNPITISIDPNTFSEIDGVQVGVGRVSRPAGVQSGAEVFVDLISTDPSELTVPSQVRIAPEQGSATFDITIVDDQLLDGDQRVSVVASVATVVNSRAFVTVTDYETVSLTVNPSPVGEDAGTATLTVTRSNTDVDAPSHWVLVNNTLSEYAPDGTLVRSVPVEWPGGGARPGGQKAHDLITLQDGRVAIYNGSINAALSIFNPNAAPGINPWTHFGSVPGLSSTPGDDSTGGIAAIGNYVFLTDIESVGDDTHGMVRIDVTTGEISRFGEGTLGSRLFAMRNSGGSTIYEFNSVDGSLVNTIQLPTIPGSPFQYRADAIVFDGTSLWVLTPWSSTTDLIQRLIRIDPDSGELLEEHSLQGMINHIWLDGLAYLDGLFYMSSPFGFGTFFGMEIQAYNPVNRQPGNVIGPENFSNLRFGEFMSSVPSTGRLLLSDDFFFLSNGIHEIDPSSGLVQSSFAAGNSLGSSRGLTSMADVTVGSTIYGGVDATVNGELVYVARNSNTIDVYTRQGTPVDMDPSTPLFRDPIITEVTFSGDLGGADVPGVSTSDLRFRDVTIGFDGLVYGLLASGDEISVHDPDTLVRLRGIDLSAVATTIAVAGSNGIYAGTATGNVIVFDFDGQIQSNLATSLGLITDIEVNIGQEVLLSNVAGAVVLTTEEVVASGDNSSITVLENAGGLAFVTFGRHPTRSTGNLAVSLQSDDLTEFQVPATVVIPVGQSSVTIDVTVVDDHERDGDQVVTLTASSPEYASTQTQVTVQDVENVGVEVLPDVVTEGDGLLPNVVRVFRTDVDGPLDFASTQTAAVTSPQPIIDDDVSISEIVMPNQVSRITDINVKLSIQHTAIPDLDVFLISPQGTRIALFNDLSSNGSNLTDTIFDDQAAVRIITGSAPFTGRFIPKQALANFIGQNPSGTWKLEVIDDSASDAGVLLGWSLEMTTIGLSEATVTLFSDDTTEATVVGTVKIPANQAEVFVDLNVLDDTDVDGTQTVNIRATQATIRGVVQDTFILVGDDVDVADAELLTIQVDRTSVSEGAGPGAIAGVITRLDNVGDAVIDLTSSDTSELSVPAFVIIPDGQTSVSFLIDAVDDADFDGDQQVTITAGGAGYLFVTSEVITVTDQEPRLQISTLTPTVAEDAGTIIFTIARLDATDLSQAQVVNLVSSDLSELLVPATVTIPIDEVSTTFVATVLEDTILDGAQTVTITASDADTVNPGINPATLNVTIEDAEFLTLTVPAGSETVLENAGVGAVTGTVSVSSLGHTAPIIVTLSNSDLTELSVPAQVVIPVGESSATFLIDVLNDPKIDRDQQVTVTARVLGYRDGVLNMTVRDHEPPILMQQSANVTDPTPAFTWAAVDGATRYDLWVNDVSKNINQLFRLENLQARLPLFSDSFEAGSFEPAKWTATNAEVDMLALNPEGSWSAHLNGNPDGGDMLESATIDLSAEPGAELTYSWQHTGSLDAPTAGQDLILSYRNASGAWIELQRQLGVGSSMTVFKTSVVTLPAEALHSNFAFRFRSIGDPNVVDAGATVDDWFIDDVTISGFEKFEPTQELGVGHYRYWVRAYDSLEQPGFWSAPGNFRVRTAPVFTSPLPNAFLAETRFPQFNWTSVVDTARYDIWIDSLTTGQSQVVRETNLPTTSFASVTANLAGGSYKAWVRAIGPDGTTGNWSNATVFTVLTTPTNIGPSGATFDRTPEIHWDPVEGASHYDIWVSRQTFTEPATIALRDQFVEGTTRTPSTDLTDGRYVVWVRAIADDGTKSPWSNPVQFFVGGRPTVTSPIADSTTSASPVIAWTGVSQSERYEIWINNSAGERVIYNQDVRATSFAIAGPLATGTYRVWVRAVSSMGEMSLWSNPVDFTVAATDAPFTFGRDRFIDDSAALLTRVPAASAGIATIAVMAGDEFQEPVAIPVVEEAPATVADVVQADAVSTEDALEVDSVMAEWAAAAGWMADRTDDSSSEDSNLGAAVVGVLAAGSVNRRRRRQQL